MGQFTKILSIDGGGIRGIIPGQVLVTLEDKLKKKAKKTDTLVDHFDFIAGTSTGGILTLAYLCPKEIGKDKAKFSASEVVDLYFERGDEIFDQPFFHKVRSLGGLLDEKYPADGIEDALDDYFGKVKLSELLKPCLITAYDIKKRKAHFFTQHDAKINTSDDFYTKDVARATSAAPTYFECERVKSFGHGVYPLIDGGVFANNPTLCAYSEVRKLFRKKNSDKHVTAKDMLILSLGTGYAKKPYYYKDAKNWGMAEWIKPLIDIMMSGVSETVDYQLKQIYEAVEAPVQYLRINTILPKDVNPDMDDASQDNLDALRNLGEDTAKKFDKELDDFVDMLLA